jgi:hypothetical protein
VGQAFVGQAFVILKKTRGRLLPSFHAMDMTQACKIEKPPEGGLLPVRPGQARDTATIR